MKKLIIILLLVTLSVTSFAFNNYLSKVIIIKDATEEKINLKLEKINKAGINGRKGSELRSVKSIEIKTIPLEYITEDNGEYPMRTTGGLTIKTQIIAVIHYTVWE